MIWDFIVVRDDGSAIRLHPNWSNTKVEIIGVPPGLNDFEIPRRGIDEICGPGNFKYLKNKPLQVFLHFDKTKAPTNFP